MIEDLFGMEQFFDAWDFYKLLMRLGINLVFTGVVISYVYGRLYANRRDFAFTYYLFNLITFSLCILLRKVPMELGFALGLFAVFGILRYRTEEIRMRDLTYLFIVLGLAIINSVANKKVSVVELVFVNSTIVGATALIELGARRSRYSQTPLLYDNLPLLQPGRAHELLADLEKRTGLPVAKYELVRIDLLRDAAELVIYYEEKPPPPTSS